MSQFTGLIPVDTTEDKLIDLWLRLKKSVHTRRSYSRAIRQFQQFVVKPLREVTLEDAIRFCESLAGRNDNTQRNAINAVKSFYSFAAKSELFPVNVMASIEPPSGRPFQCGGKPHACL